MAISREILIGARLAAGYMVVADAADEMGLPRNVVLRAEAGVTTFLDKHLLGLVKTYGVSEGFVSDGLVESDTDKLAQRLGSILASLSGDPSNMDEAATARLKEMRMAAGFTSARSAASATGWKLPSYIAHENGKRPLSAERMIGYALGFGFRPEYAVLNSGPMVADADEAVGWWKNRRDASTSERPAVVWAWLNKSSNARRQSFPVLNFTGTSFVLLDEQITLPIELLPTESLDGFVYGIRDKTSAGTKIIVIDPGKAQSTTLRLSDGHLQMQSSEVKDYVPHNPLSEVQSLEGSVLGSVVYSLEIHSVGNK